MHSYLSYVAGLEALARQALSSRNVPAAEMAVHLDGGPYRALRTAISLEALQSAGAFFTGEGLRAFALSGLQLYANDCTPVYDPACGAGDLLLGAAGQLPVLSSLEETLDQWGNRLGGSDIHDEFIRTTRARLVLAAYARGARASSGDLRLESTFPKIRAANAFELDALPGSPVVLINPPYGMTAAPEDCEWTNGSVSLAALFVDHLLSLASNGTRIVAILPDVLRSGARYKKWRASVSSRATLKRIDVWGVFDSATDVDVFVLDMQVDTSANAIADAQWLGLTAYGSTVSDFFEVSIGPVIPHRHLNRGNWAPYLHSRNAPPWASVTEIITRRRFHGRLIEPPFLVVRRTSSPHDSERAVATMVYGSRPVAVENHLIVIKPKGGSVQLCRALLRHLKEPQTTEWLNSRIRCRHLTIGAISSLPFPRP